MGIPVGEFLGRPPPVVVTIYVYDDQGRISRTETRQESHWLDSDREALYALLEWQAGVHLCGVHMDEALRSAGRSVDDWVGIWEQCLPCQALERDQRAQQKKDEELHTELTSGRIWRVISRQVALDLAKQAAAMRRR